MDNKGFSLVELIAVIAIIMILTTLATLDFNSWQKRSQIERQTRELFADLNQARIDSFQTKKRHSIVMQPNSYTFKSYSSENENRNAGTTVQTKNVSYQITEVSGPSDNITEYDIRGFTNDTGTFEINPVGTAAQVDCIVIATGRTNLGKMQSGTCVIK